MQTRIVLENLGVEMGKWISLVQYSNYSLLTPNKNLGICFTSARHSSSGRISSRATAKLSDNNPSFPVLSNLQARNSLHPLYINLACIASKEHCPDEYMLSWTAQLPQKVLVHLAINLIKFNRNCRLWRQEHSGTAAINI